VAAERKPGRLLFPPGQRGNPSGAWARHERAEFGHHSTVTGGTTGPTALLGSDLTIGLFVQGRILGPGGGPSGFRTRRRTSIQRPSGQTSPGRSGRRSAQLYDDQSTSTRKAPPTGPSTFVSLSRAAPRTPCASTHQPASTTPDDGRPPGRAGQFTPNLRGHHGVAAVPRRHAGPTALGANTVVGTLFRPAEPVPRISALRRDVLRAPVEAGSAGRRGNRALPGRGRSGPQGTGGAGQTDGQGPARTTG